MIGNEKKIKVNHLDLSRKYHFSMTGFWLCLILFWSCSTTKITSESETLDFARFVNPFIGTSGTGHTFPGATVPFGMVQLSPRTGNYRWEYTAGYQYGDSAVLGFTHTQLNGTGIADLGDILMLPFMNVEASEGMKVAFSKEKEAASPGYYTTYLTDEKIKVELTSGQHTGYHKYTFDEGGEAKILISLTNILFSWGDSTQSRVLDAQIVQEDAHTLSGYSHSRFWADRKVFFTIEFSKPFDSILYLPATGQRATTLNYKVKAGDQIEAKVGISSVSIAGAKQNLELESIGKTFEDVRKAARDEWNNHLSKIAIEGDDADKANFYTSMYHLFIQPNNIADVDGQYRGSDDTIRISSTGDHYSTLSIWDTYRAAHPLYTILTPDKNRAFVSAMLRQAKIQGYLPIWALWGKETHCMIGNHAVPILVDAYFKGQLSEDPEEVYNVIKKSLTRNLWGKYNWKIYDRYGYFPFDIVKVESVSRTLEATIDDWAAAQMAKALGKVEDYEFFIRRAENYSHLFDTTYNLMRPKNSMGAWQIPFDPFRISHAGSAGGAYTEGNAWQYSWHVQHNPEGLVHLMGGKEAFVQKLDSLFSLERELSKEGFVSDVSGLIGQYAHGNEPSHHVAYLYNYAGAPEKTRVMIPKILKSQYANRADGLSGNDDCGQMSAWYIFSSLGFYPVNPASGKYDLGIPAFSKAKINLEDGKTFEIRRVGTGENLKQISLNGQPLDRLYITHEEIVNGGHLAFILD